MLHSSSKPLRTLLEPRSRPSTTQRDLTDEATAQTTATSLGETSRSSSIEPDSATFRFHNLRHACAMLLLSLNVSPKIVQDAEPSRL
jgi:integrase